MQLQVVFFCLPQLYAHSRDHFANRLIDYLPGMQLVECASVCLMIIECMFIVYNRIEPRKTIKFAACAEENSTTQINLLLIYWTLNSSSITYSDECICSLATYE